MWRGGTAGAGDPRVTAGAETRGGPGGRWRMRVGRAGPRRPRGPGCAPPLPAAVAPVPLRSPPAGAPRFLAARTRTTHRTPAGRSSRAAGAPEKRSGAARPPRLQPPPRPGPRAAGRKALTHLSLSMSAAEACGKPERGSAGGRRALGARRVQPGTAGTGGRGGRGGGAPARAARSVGSPARATPVLTNCGPGRSAGARGGCRVTGEPR